MSDIHYFLIIMSLRSNQMYHTGVSQIRWDTFLTFFPLCTSIKSRKLSINLSPYSVVFPSKYWAACNKWLAVTISLKHNTQHCWCISWIIFRNFSRVDNMSWSNLHRNIIILDGTAVFHILCFAEMNSSS